MDDIDLTINYLTLLANPNETVEWLQLLEEKSFGEFSFIQVLADVIIVCPINITISEKYFDLLSPKERILYSYNNDLLQLYLKSMLDADALKKSGWEWMVDTNIVSEGEDAESIRIFNKIQYGEKECDGNVIKECYDRMVSESFSLYSVEAFCNAPCWIEVHKLANLLLDYLGYRTEVNEIDFQSLYDELKWE